MSNKENLFSQIGQQRPSIYLTQQSKPSRRYPLRSLDPDFNSIQLQPTQLFPKNNTSLKLRNSQNLKQFLGSHRSQLNLSLKQKFMKMHINSVHELIASAREKKLQIEDLLLKQQSKAQYEELDQNQISASLRKLKKVVRLMEIVCKIILGHNQQNSYMDLNSQHEINLREMHQLSLENFEKQIQNKNKEIKKLNNLISILSIPAQKQQSLSASRKFDESFEVKKSENSSISIARKTQLSAIQQEIKEMAQNSVQTIDFSETHYADRIKKQKLGINLMISQEYSLWNILDAQKNSEIKQQQPTSKYFQIYQTVNMKLETDRQQKIDCQTIIQPSLLTKKPEMQQDVQTGLNCANLPRLTRVLHPLVHVQPKSNFLKRYKSMVKIALNSLNLCNTMIMIAKYKQKCNGECMRIKDQILQVSQKFNIQYHRNGGKYDDQFCKEIREKLNKLYQQLYNIYNQSKSQSNEDLGFFQTSF